MRVIAGSARSIPLKTIEGMDTRPTTDRIKETLFNIIQRDIEGCDFLDVFAGSGGIGIEALSRGASFCGFIENQRKAADCIQENLKKTKLDAKGEVLCVDVLSGLRRFASKHQFDFVFMDPPYGKELESDAIDLAVSLHLLKEDGILILETKKGENLSFLETMPLKLVRIKEYKSNQHVFLVQG